MKELWERLVKKPETAVIKAMPYSERLKGYERDKQTLLANMRSLPAKEFADKLRELQRKWGI